MPVSEEAASDEFCTGDFTAEDLDDMSLHEAVVDAVLADASDSEVEAEVNNCRETLAEPPVVEEGFSPRDLARMSPDTDDFHSIDTTISFEWTRPWRQEVIHTLHLWICPPCSRKLNGERVRDLVDELLLDDEYQRLGIWPPLERLSDMRVRLIQCDHCILERFCYPYLRGQGDSAEAPT